MVDTKNSNIVDLIALVERTITVYQNSLAVKPNSSSKDECKRDKHWLSSLLDSLAFLVGAIAASYLDTGQRVTSKEFDVYEILLRRGLGDLPGPPLLIQLIDESKIGKKDANFSPSASSMGTYLQGLARKNSITGRVVSVECVDRAERACVSASAQLQGLGIHGGRSICSRRTL